MYVEKIFSDYNDEERLYSVIMTEEELDIYESLFSEEDDEKYKKKTSKVGKKALIDAGLAAGALGYSHHQGKKLLGLINSEGKQVRNQMNLSKEITQKEADFAKKLTKGSIKGGTAGLLGFGLGAAAAARGAQYGYRKYKQSKNK